ncbi:unnamed protein product [Phytophthora lilii]|uniref:Unnamed protein product n=1 Tax=Phytophthora lilii TaxID=2077276 RepID=A0A9W6WQ87_9STRA|nr:unnamed protein product [Phytophthora lilii]
MQVAVSGKWIYIKLALGPGSSLQDENLGLTELYQSVTTCTAQMHVSSTYAGCGANWNTKAKRTRRLRLTEHFQREMNVLECGLHVTTTDRTRRAK